MKQQSAASAGREPSGTGYRSSGAGCSANLYGLFSRSPGMVGRHLAASAGACGECCLEIARWNRLASEWGLRAELDWPEPAKPLVKLWDVNEVVAWLIYPIDGAWQIDEFDGTSRRIPSLAAALQAVADL